MKKLKALARKADAALAEGGLQIPPGPSSLSTSEGPHSWSHEDDTGDADGHPFSPQSTPSPSSLSNSESPQSRPYKDDTVDIEPYPISQALVGLDSDDSLACLIAIEKSQALEDLKDIASIYTPLRPPTDIRLLYLKMDAQNMVRCTLFNSGLGIFPYHAISHTWIDSEYDWYGHSVPRTARIMINNNLVEVPGRLALILSTICRYGYSRVWLDAICINQDDQIERSAQVVQMGKIFSKAQGVIVFLGKPSQDSDVCLDILAKFDWSVRGRFSALVGHKYWSRAWILQEITMASNLLVLCGNLMLLISDKVRMFEILQDYHGEMSEMEALHQLTKHGPSPCRDLLTWTSGFDCSDPHDVFYAKIALAQDPELIGRPDYTVPVSWLCVDFAVRYVEKYKDLELLRRCLSANAKSVDIPSWVPDWQNFSGPWIKDRSHFNEDIRHHLLPSTHRLSDTVCELVVWGFVVSDGLCLSGSSNDLAISTDGEQAKSEQDVAALPNNALLCFLYTPKSFPFAVLQEIHEPRLHYILTRVPWASNAARWCREKREEEARNTQGAIDWSSMREFRIW